ncbi:MAG: O-antigen ligase family protein [Verrucomicrobiota bacterium]
MSAPRALHRPPPAAYWLAGALLLLPWFYRVPWDTPRAIPLVLLTPALVLGHRELSAALGHIFSARPGVTVPLLVLLGAVLLSTAMSPHWAASAVTAATWCLLALTAVLVGQLIAAAPATSTLLAGALAASSAIGVVVHAARWIGGEPPDYAFYVHHRLMGLHTFGGALASLALLVWTWPKTTAPRLLWLVVGLVNWAGLLWTGSRSPLIGIAVAVALWLFKMERPARRQLLFASVFLVAGGLVLSVIAWTPEPYLGWWSAWTRSAGATTAAAITSNRSDFWLSALNHVRAAPWFGHGADAYGYLTPQLEGAQPHNLALQLVLDLGVPGAFCALLLLAGCLWRGYRASSASSAQLFWAAFATGCVVASFLDGYFYYTLAALPAMIALGASATSQPPTDPTPSPRPLARAVMRLWPFIAAASAALLLLHSVLFHLAAHRPTPVSPSAFTARLWHAFPSTTVNVDEWVPRWTTPFPDAALATARRAIPHSQTPELFRVQIARLLAQRGDFAGAIAELERARADSRPTQHAALDILLARMRASAAP